MKKYILVIGLTTLVGGAVHASSLAPEQPVLLAQNAKKKQKFQVNADYKVLCSNGRCEQKSYVGFVYAVDYGNAKWEALADINYAAGSYGRLVDGSVSIRLTLISR